MEKRIAFIICYLGKFPWYFDYFIFSCKHNPTVDFFLISDNVHYPNKLPLNVRIIYRTIEQLNFLASQKLGFTTNILSGYKLCDFKPTYGLLFNDLLKGYDYWGHGDLDIILGDLRAFITDEILEYNELISVRHDFLTGQFLLFRNNDKMNSLFTLSKDYRKVLTNSDHYCFDETNFQWQGFTDGKPFYEIQSEIESMTHLVKRLEQENYLNAYFDFLIVEGTPGKLRWKHGKLYYKNRYEILLYHLVLFKKVCHTRKSPVSIPDSFSISPTRIYHK